MEVVMGKVENINQEEIITTYARYEDVDKAQLERDIDEIKAQMKVPDEEDFQHLLKMERWGRIATFSGYGLIFRNWVSSFLVYRDYCCTIDQYR